MALVLLPLGGCAPRQRPTYVPDPQSARGLPADPIALVSLADELSGAKGPGALAALERARAALQRALERGHPQPFAVHWRLARACLQITGKTQQRARRLAAAHEGVEHGRKASLLQPLRAEGFYYLALNLGRLAEGERRLSLVKPMVAAGERARLLDANFDGAGALVFLGKVYLTAPAWPVSVGDTQKALRCLTEAVQRAPQSPMARLFLAQALAAEEEYAAARAQLKRAMGMGLEKRWRLEAEQALTEVEAKLGPTRAAGSNPVKGQ